MAARWRWIVVWLVGCGIGEPIVLGVTDAGSGGISGSAGAAGSGGSAGDAAVRDAGSDADVLAVDGGQLDAASDAVIDAHSDVDGAEPDAAAPACHERISDDGFPSCSYSARSNLAPGRTKWRWPAPDSGSPIVPLPSLIPLVANFTDDNRDGAVDLCDTPDVLVVTIDYDTGESLLVLLSGDTGALRFTFDQTVSADVNPALADLDDDGLPDVVAVNAFGQLVAFDHQGHTRWVGDVPAWLQTGAGGCHALAVHDLEGDGDAEILAGFDAFDDTGRFLFGATAAMPPLPWPFPQEAPPCTVPIAADLNRDGSLEVLFGHEVYDARGQLLWSLGGGFGYPHAVNLDADPQLEVVIARSDGDWIAQHDGYIEVAPQGGCGMAPLTIADTSGDGTAEIVDGLCGLMPFAVLDGRMSPTWPESPAFLQGTAATAAFDFGGRGAASVIAVETAALHVFDGDTGTLVLSVGAGSFSGFAYPVVVDVDNDRSADLLVVDETIDGYALSAVSAIDDSWLPTRRIWNQVTYVVTNIDESSALPRRAAIARRTPLSFHHNALIEHGGVCVIGG